MLLLRSPGRGRDDDPRSAAVPDKQRAGATASSRRTTSTWVVLTLAASLLSACTSAQSCLDAVPADLRADVARTALEREFLERGEMPAADFDLAITGRSDEFLPKERAAQVRRFALSYGHCVRDRRRVR